MFLDVSHLLAPLPPGRYACACVFDADGDGRDEVFLGRLDGPNRVLKWVGGLLRDVTPPTLSDPDRPATASAAADVNGDGREELYIATAAGMVDRLYARNPDGTWADLFSRSENRPAWQRNRTTAVVALDRRGGGRYGFVVAAEEHRLRLFELTGDGDVTDLAPAVGLDRDAETTFTCLLPIPLVSGRTDLFATRRLDSSSLFTLRADGTFTDVAWQYGLTNKTVDVGAVTPISAGTRFGLVVADRDAESSLWSPQQDGSFRNIATPAFAFPSAPVATFAADFDNDGAEEILFLNVNEPSRLFRPGPHLVDTGVLAAPIGPDAVAAVADVDGDGRLELLIADSTVRLFCATGPDYDWLRVQPLTRFGAPARGATVLTQANDRTILRVLSGTGPVEAVAHFGLGPQPGTATLTVTWPDGAKLTLPCPAPRQLHRIPYPAG